MCSDVTWARRTHISHRHQLVFMILLRFFDDYAFFRNNRNHLHLAMVILAQTNMAECQS